MIKRRFIPGEEWLYLKLYSGPKILEDILVGLYPEIKKLYSSGIINKFFFIRYIDEDYHLRLRFQLNDIRHTGLLIETLSLNLRNFSDSRILSKVCYDTYNREIERYGSATIEDAETLFCTSSWEILEIVSTEQDYTQRWLLGVKCMDHLLGTLGLTTKAKYELYQKCYLNLLNEFSENKITSTELKQRYRTNSQAIEKMITQKEHITVPNIDALQTTIARLLDLEHQEQLEVTFDQFLFSIVHMHYNRLFRIKQRSHEFVIYYMMSNYYKSSVIREAKKEVLR
ncbi:MAG TPA: thiopeptide-type bacteriocin biosynthesis protein [Chitinophagaceae bacterium]|jgi:thiopeptide-type bacteriocin biosynthesis protein|nr:thiopeptide-type bacteriocin biosynthesis protein [Chitinophagaceae bacterium]